MTFSQLLAAIRSVESESSIEKLFNETPRLDDRQIGRWTMRTVRASRRSFPPFKMGTFRCDTMLSHRGRTLRLQNTKRVDLATDLDCNYWHIRVLPPAGEFYVSTIALQPSGGRRAAEVQCKSRRC
eukprot:686067-Prorocentrum_minimum.AAC.2